MKARAKNFKPEAPIIGDGVSSQDLLAHVLNGENLDLFHTSIKRAVYFMSENYAQEIRLENLAREARMSKYHLCRVFKRWVGISCIAYLNRVRIERAKEMLIQKYDSITNIAYDTGFKNLVHFERTFKGHVGITPSGYRKIIRKNINSSKVS